MNAHVRKVGGKLVDESVGRGMWFRCCHAGTSVDFNRVFGDFAAAFPEAAAYVRTQEQVRVL
jgi:hypothetical protein